MTDIEAFIWHDLDGNITAVGHLVGESQRKVEPLTSDGRRVVKLTVAAEQLATLHLTHSIDVKKAALSPRSYKPATSF